MMDKLELEGRLDYTPRAQDSPSIEVVPVEEEEKCENEDALTKELRMEEGRKMFQAFAARMFEQRVLSAYREQIAEERRLKLLQELEEETRQEQLREERKEREKEKKREKKRIQKQQKEEEKAAKEAQRLAEEQRIAEERRRKSEAAQKRKEEERRVKEERIVREQEQQREEARKREVKAREDDYKVKVEEDAKEDAKALTVSDQKDPSPVTKVVEPTSIPSSQLSLSAGPSSPVSKPVVVGEAKAYVPTQVPVQSLESLWSQSFPSILSTPSSQHQTPSRHSPRPDFVPFQGGQHDCIHTQEYAGHIPTIGMSFHEPDFGMVDQEYQRDGALRESMFYPGSSVEYDQVLPPMSIPFSPHVPVFTNSPSLAARNVLAIGSARRTSVPGRGSDAYAPIERPLAMGPPNEYNDVASDNLKPTGPSSGFGELSIGFTEFVGDPTMDRRPRSLSVGLVEDIAVSSGQLYPQYQQYFQQQQQQPPYQQLYQEQPFQPFQHQDAFMPSQLDGFSGGHLMDRLSTLDFLMHDDDYQSSLFADSFFNRDKKGTLGE
ncbi:MAG: hypothetical protein BYD32DRAFT_201924 [Podila humilis]|nr:MAG: hypothetical protein BYD32DRAFT_201924 [Podila humilis]